MLLAGWLWTDKKGLFFLFETSLKKTVAQTGLRLLAILLPQSLSCWDYRHVPSCWGSKGLTAPVRPTLALLTL